MVDPGRITGLILAGGQGSRLGGVDKGLQVFDGLPLAQRALQRLAPQVGRTMISANRHLDEYRRLQVPVWPDEGTPGSFAGPLAGFLAGLRHCDTPYLLTVPCDCPHFPPDLAAHLAEGLVAAGADLALARTPTGLEPAFCLMKRELLASLARYVASGKRKVERWTAGERRTEVLFDDSTAFFNINTPDDLARA